MVVNHFKMRKDVDTYHLGGMGCSSGVSAPGLAAKLLQAMPRGCCALVINHENITTQLYPGTIKNFLVTNVIFRLGGAACLISNKSSDRSRAKYVLDHCIRTHTGADEKSFGCMSVKLDQCNVPGVYLPEPSILKAVTADAVEANVHRLAPLIMPFKEKLRFATHWFQTNVMGKEMKPFCPDMTKAFEHICIHAGGRIVIESVGKGFNLPDSYLEPAANTLYWYGNVSSASVWYTQAWIETVRGVKKGDRSWHIGLGAGFEANSAVWRALRDINTPHYAWKHVLGGSEKEAMEVFIRCGSGGKVAEFPPIRSLVNELRTRNEGPQMGYKDLPPFTYPPYSHSNGHVMLRQVA